VDVRGKTNRNTSPVIGIQLGHQFANGSSPLKPAIELEGLLIRTKQKADIANPATELLANVRQPSFAPLSAFIATEYAAGEHRFSTQMDKKIGLLMASAVVNFDNGGKLKPYIGGGFGLAVVQYNHAVSLQTNPAGPIEVTTDTKEEVNHFNSRPYGTDLTWAAQAKAGLQFQLSDRISAFAEYRLVHVGATSVNFGSTSYTGHSPTDNWVWNGKASNIHNGLVGIRFTL
jgi:opacity protein-like surface antigen